MRAIELRKKEDIQLLKSRLDTQANQMRDLGIREIIKKLGLLQNLWIKDGIFYKRALKELGEAEIIDELKLLPEILNEDHLLDRVKGEFGKLDFLDGFTIDYKRNIKIYYAPLGQLLHITAGNISLGAIDSLLMGLLTKNNNLLKLSSSYAGLLPLFCESLEYLEETKVIADQVVLLSYKGGDQNVEVELFKLCQGILCWGGDEMASSLRKNVPIHCKIIEHGPKISIHVVSKLAFNSGKVDYGAILKDVLTWKQMACANSQNIFLENGIDANEFNQNLINHHQEKTIDYDEESAVELIKDYYSGLYNEFLTGQKAMKTLGLQLQYDQAVLSTTALNGSVKVKHFKSFPSLANDLRPYAYFMQTCGLSILPVERANVTKSLAIAGIDRFTDLGEMLAAKVGAPHDGSYALVDLTRVCADEHTPQVEEILLEKSIPFFADKDTHNLPIIEADNFKVDILNSQNSLLARNLDKEGGYFFASGGTTGKPKFIYYSYQEFEEVAKLLAKSYQINGLKEGNIVANLFMAGNMWSSFSAVQQALEICGCIQLPIGGLIDAQDLMTYIQYFNCRIIFGLPSLITQLAQKTQGLNIETIFYAGEKFSESTKEIVRRNWGTLNFISAGYASVDVGPIGYQDASCTGTEHYLFEEAVNLEIINGEGVVTSKVRKNMPVIRYKSGDKIQIIPSKDHRIKFKILGRADKKVNIWGCRFEYNQVKELLLAESYLSDIQLKLTHEKLKERLVENLEIHYYGNLMEDQEQLKLKLYNSLQDIRNTVSYEFFSKRVLFKENDLLLNARTGKPVTILDQRN